MNENLGKICRFCLFKEQSDDTNKILNLFESDLEEDMIEKIRSYTQIFVSPNDKIPPNICMTCINCIVTFDKFLESCWKSEKVLKKMYNVSTQLNRNSNLEVTKSSISNEQTIDCTSEKFANSDIDINNFKIEEISDDLVDDSDSDISSVKEEKVALKGSTDENINTHKDRLNAKQIGSDNKYTCGICSKQFPSFFEYQDHQETHNGQFVFSCTKCDQVFPERKLLVEHDANHKVACQVCNKMVLPKSLAAHLKKHTDLYRCPQCNLSHTSKATLEKHIKARHTDQKGLVCHICGKQNSCQSSLNRHLATHSPTRPYQCKFCTFSAKSQNILKIHMCRKHLGIQRSCKECTKSFKSEISLKQHMKRIHTARKYICHICQKGFTEKYSLDQHISKGHSKQCPHECKVCSKEFHTIRELKEHMHSHREGGVNCKNCGKKFFYKKYLEKHMVKCVSSERSESFKDKLQRLKSTISLPGSSQLDNLKTTH